MKLWGRKLNPEDISRSHRVGQPVNDGKPRPVLVKFTSYRARQKLFLKRSKLKGAKGVNANVYINEDLCKARADLAYKARTARRQKLIADTWVFDGEVFVKDSAGNVRTVF